ncbi:MAG: DUF2851 family protein [Opitutales bacterium]
MKPVAVAEIQGLYGPVTISERVLHRLWRDGDFTADRLRTRSGKVLEVVSPGRWNHQEGPDFREAEVRLDGQVRRGDVELHFYERDWRAHGHQADPAFDGVMLHVVMYGDRAGGTPVATSAGQQPECLTLLPYLSQDLEAVAAEQALDALVGGDGRGLRGWLLGMDAVARRKRLREGARTRWRQKISFARQRLEVLGWTRACHVACLEVLGYRRNRAPMMQLAEQYSPEAFARASLDELYACAGDHWRLSGSRPENHPRKRLAQYQDLLRHRPEWPEALAEWGTELPELPDNGETKAVRRRAKFSPVRQSLHADLFGEAFGGTRFDTFVVDAVFPLLAARTGRDFAPWWVHWFRGDAPDDLPRLLKETGVYGPEQPACNGYQQGLLQLMLEEPA